MLLKPKTKKKMTAVQLLHCVLMLWICLHKTAFGADEVCGQSIDDNPLPVLTSGLGKINSSQSAWPWMAAIRLRERSGIYTPWCSGFLIDRRHVLSAAHCYIRRSVDEYRVRIGNVNQEVADEYRVIRIAIPLGYKEGSYYDNIAVLTLNREVDFPDYNPVCLPDDKVRRMVLDNKDATAAGWGADRPRGEINRFLQHVSGITIVRNQECERSFHQALRSSFRRQFPKGIDRSFLCAGFIEGGKDVCGGDSGGPLMIRYRNRWFAVGMTSFGIGCGVAGMPGGYTNISNYVDWIKENTQDTDKVCGQSNAIPPILSGVKATEGAWPWMISSGAPLMIWKKNQWYAVGLVSFGLNCERNTVPGGFIRISSYLDWIRENIND